MLLPKSKTGVEPNRKEDRYDQRFVWNVEQSAHEKGRSNICLMSRSDLELCPQDLTGVQELVLVCVTFKEEEHTSANMPLPAQRCELLNAKCSFSYVVD